MKIKTKERWKDIKGYKNMYQSSDLGKIKSLDRKIIMNYPGGIRIWNKPGRILKPAKNHSGYLIVVLSKQGKMTTKTVHRIVALCFLKKPKNNLRKFTNHKNGIKTDNRVENLEWVTNRENNTHAYINKNTSSRFVGVCWDKNIKKWLAQIRINNKQINIGLFKSEKKAAQAYQKYLKENRITNKFKLKN